MRFLNRKMYCTKDCNCNLCRELRSFKPFKWSKRKALGPLFAGGSILSHFNENFILRRSTTNTIKTFQPQSLRCTQGNDGVPYQFGMRQMRTPSPTIYPKDMAATVKPMAKDDVIVRDGKNSLANHKIVIYFGDSLKRSESSVMRAEGIHEAKENDEGSREHRKVIEEVMEEVVEAANTISTEGANDSLPYYIESLDDGIINIRISRNYETASALVRNISEATVLTEEDFAYGANEDKAKLQQEAPEGFDGDKGSGLNGDGGGDGGGDGDDDWSFVQKWRERPIENGRYNTVICEAQQTDGMAYNTNNQSLDLELSNNSNHNEMTVLTAAVRMQNSTNCDSQTKPVPPPYRGGLAASKHSEQSNPSKQRQPILSGSYDFTSQHPSFDHPMNIGIPTDMNCGQGGVSGAKTNPMTRTHHHEFRALERVQECNSSSDENRSSGHASMSDTGGHGSSSPGGGITLGPLPEDRLAAGVTNRSTRSRALVNHTRARHRAAPLKTPWGGNGLEDIKLAIQQLTMRSQTSTSTYSSSAGSESSEPARRLGRYASMETVNTNVTNADEFIWVDSHNRLIELQQPPWTQQSFLNVIRNGRCKEQADRVSLDAISRLSYLLQRALVRIARETQRLSSNFGVCSKQEVASGFKIILSSALADSCLKACFRAAAMFSVPGDTGLKQSKSLRAGLQLSIGKIHRWMIDARIAKFVHEYAAVYLTAGIENLLEDILLQCLPRDPTTQLTVSVLENAISISGDLWSLLQPHAHLNAGRIASGALSISNRLGQTTVHGDGLQNTLSLGNRKNNIKLEPCLLTTCVGSITELRELLFRTLQKFQNISISNSGLSALFYFMRCSQLEQRETIVQQGSIGGNIGPNQNIQELSYERAYVILPPLLEWVRVAVSNTEYRSASVIDSDDIMQAARLLLPGVDCPIRPIGQEEELPTMKVHYFASNACVNTEDKLDMGNQATISLAFKLMLTGRAELLVQASNLLPTTTRYDTPNHAGMTALMIATIHNDEAVIQALLNAGCDVNVEVPAVGNSNCPAIHPETQHWTAVTFAAAKGNYVALHILLERGGNVEGGARQSEEKHTLTPLQVACGSGNIEVVALLLAHGANAFFSTQQKDAISFAGSAQRGCYSAISVASTHGQRNILRKLLSSPINSASKDVLSLEEMLAEGDASTTSRSENNPETVTSGDLGLTLNKSQIKSLQEAMYHSTENNHLDITIELRSLGVPWTLHCWMNTLAAAHELRFDVVIDQLLQDFLQVCPDDYSPQFVTECLPLLFNIFRFSKNEGTTLLLADIFATCFGREPIKAIKKPSPQAINTSRIDPKFVNNPDLSDVHFRVEGNIFYGHKIVLITASPRFKNMLTTKLNDTGGGIPIVQINDIRYHIFQLVMIYLYSGGCNALDIVENDVLELMAAASFFQLDGLLCSMEARCSDMINIDNVVAMYIHAKVYNANKLLEFCQGFLLQNMVALLTYDDSVKRLLFAKKIPNHDVLLGLLNTLQQRIKDRKSTAHPGHFRHHLIQQPMTADLHSDNKK